MDQNRHVVLKSRPGVNSRPVEENFCCEPCDSVDPESLKPGEAIIKTCYLSVDPAQRCQMNENTGANYLRPWAINETIIGLAGVGVVLVSKHPEYSVGDLIQGTPTYPWKAYFKQDVTWCQKLDQELLQQKPSLALSLLSIAGLTAILGIQEKGHVTPGVDLTCVISGAAGACGSLAGQIARLEGCAKVIGICGTSEKCAWLTEDLGFDGAINYKTENVESHLQQACPGGIDLYFDNVGGEISDTVIKQMKPNSHIILCGQISVYNKDVPYPPPLSDEISLLIKENNITRDRFLVLNYSSKFGSALKQLTGWYLSGKIKVRETVIEGLENAGKAFVSMMDGGNIGKQLVHVADP